MKNEIDDLLNSVFGSRPGARPSAARPKPAPARQPVRPAPTPSAQTPPKKESAASASPAPQPSGEEVMLTLGEIERAVPAMNDALNTRIAQQRREIEALNQNARADIERINAQLASAPIKTLAEQTADAARVPVAQAAPVPPAGAEGFAGLAETVGKKVLGQDAYLQKLAIALKRPYVMGYTDNAARNTILITGPRDTGKQLSLYAAAEALHQAGVFATPALAFVDLALYPNANTEKLFLQDLYMALNAPADLVVFTHYETCYPGFLHVIADLVQNGKSPLSSRYVLQNGRLVDAGTALVTDAVSALTPRGKYLILLTERPVSKLADSFGAPFVSALGDICETAALDDSALLAIAQAELAKLTDKVTAMLRLSPTLQDGVAQLAASQAAGGRGVDGVVSFCNDAYRALAQYQLEHDAPAGTPVALSASEGVLTADFGQGAMVLFNLLPGGYTGEMDAVKAEFDAVVGLAEIKKYILSLEDNYAIQTRRKAAGLQTASVSMHMIFTGNPGTGKTTIARLVSKYLKAMGVLTGGQLVEVTRADLVGKYVGHTAPLTMQVMQSAIGGVLFIDEAYSLYRGKDDNFGLECIDALVKGMEDNRENLIVILAGYSKEMAQFLTANSGLKSRFPNIIEFPNYSGEELLAILKLQAKGKGYTLDSACDTNLLAYFNAVQMTRARDAGNGRLARNKLEEAILSQAKRLRGEPQADLSTLLPEDFVLDDVAGASL